MEDFTAEVKSYIKTQGAELVGVGPVERWARAPEGHRPEDILPGARSVIVYAFPMLESTFMSPNPRVYVLRYHQLREKTQNSGYEVCHFLERRGHYAVNFPGTAPMSVEDKILFSDFSYKHAAELTGLGEIGWNQLLLTPQYGPRVWLMAVITTAELIPDPLLEKNVCLGEECNLCIEQCPQKALTPGQPTDKSKCTRRPNQYGLSHLIKHMKDILNENDPKKRDNLLYGPTTWGIWMHLQYGGPDNRCHYCVSACPVGKTETPNKSDKSDKKENQ